MEAKVIDHPGLFRTEKGFVVNRNDSEYSKALARKREAEKQKSLEDRVRNIESAFAEILRILKEKDGNQ